MMALSFSKKVSTLVKGITSKRHEDFYWLNCLHSFRTKKKFKSHEKLCKKNVFCGIVMPSENNNILVFNQCMKSDKMLFIIYPDTESLIREIDESANNPENYSTTKIGEHIPCGYSMLAIWVFDHIENKHTLYR